MEKNLVSIIVPVYNRELVIRKCYDSLINQTYKNIEIILVDDGSTDNSLKVMKEFTDERVIVLSQENAGPSEARRHGFKVSKGKYICFVDSDDTISNDYVSLLVNRMIISNTKMCMGRVGLHVDNSIIKSLIFKGRKKPKDIDLSSMKEQFPALSAALVSKMFDRDILNFKKVDFRANEDLIFIYPLYLNVLKISVENNAIYHNYYSKNSQRNLLFGYKFENIYNTFGTLNLVYEEIRKLDKLDEYYDEIEMLFIRNIFERINNISDSVKNNTYRNKFVSVLLDYLEFYFPNWNKNKYYLKGFKLGEYTDRLRIMRAKKIISRVDRTMVQISLDEIYERYKNIERLYERIK